MKIKFSYIMLLIALAVAGCAAYFSVWGLSKLFAGAATSVIILCTTLEIAKIITTTALHKYWNKLAKGLRLYLSFGVIILMLVTSMGIYGFLSSAYKQTSNKLEIQNGELSILDNKKSFFQKNITDNEKIIIVKNKRIDQLTNLRNKQETRLDSAKNNRARDKARNDIALATQEIQKLTNDIDLLNNKNNILSDSIGNYNIKTLNLNSKSEISAEVGPLKYISDLTGISMDRVVNYLILLLIIVFDPLALALIIATNRIFELNNEDKSEMLKELIKQPIELGIKELNKDFKEFAENSINKIENDEDKSYKSWFEDDNKNLQYNEILKVEPMVYSPKKLFTVPPIPIIKQELIEEPIIDLEPKENEIEPEVDTTVNNEAKEEIIESKIEEDLNISIKQDVLEVKEEPKTEEIIEESIINTELEQPTTKLKLEDIKEIKEIKRGFSVNIPVNNRITRL